MASSASAILRGDEEVIARVENVEARIIGDDRSVASGSGNGQQVSMVEEVEVRPQAGPLPSKRGEIGFRQSVHAQVVHSGSDGSSSSTQDVLPARHPADRDASSTPSGSSSSPDNAPAAPSGSDAPSEASSMHSTSKRSFICFFKPKRIPKVYGISLTSVLLFALQSSFIVGTIVAWAMTAKHMPGSQSSSGGSAGINSTQVFIHVTFGIATLVQLVFLERSIFRLRAERYAHVHPGEILPRTRGLQRGNTALGLAPWGRPPLPTYAAALAQNGLGTGDVEDNIIAVPPPPAYGNTRGSKLLLAGSMSENLRARRYRERVRHSGSTIRDSWMSNLSDVSERSSRPVSYKSQDSAWDEAMDAHRAMRLEETLSHLEDGRHSRVGSFRPAHVH